MLDWTAFTNDCLQFVVFAREFFEEDQRGLGQQVSREVYGLDFGFLQHFANLIDAIVVQVIVAQHHHSHSLSLGEVLNQDVHVLFVEILLL